LAAVLLGPPRRRSGTRRTVRSAPAGRLLSVVPEQCPGHPDGTTIRSGREREQDTADRGHRDDHVHGHVIVRGRRRGAHPPHRRDPRDRETPVPCRHRGRPRGVLLRKRRGRGVVARTDPRRSRRAQPGGDLAETLSLPAGQQHDADRTGDGGGRRGALGPSRALHRTADPQARRRQPGEGPGLRQHDDRRRGQGAVDTGGVPRLRRGVSRTRVSRL
jgi:hypothetical protein